VLICDKPPFAVVLPHKTGTKSLRLMLAARFPVLITDPFNEIPAEYKNYSEGPVICTIRNPYSRVSSWWNYIRRQENIPANPTARHLEAYSDANRLGFVRFLCEDKNRPLPVSELLGGLPVTHWVRTENFVRDVRNLPLPGMKQAKVLHAHNGGMSDWRSIFKDHPEMISWARDTYVDDFVMGNYSTEFPW